MSRRRRGLRHPRYAVGEELRALADAIRALLDLPPLHDVREPTEVERFARPPCDEAIEAVDRRA